MSRKTEEELRQAIDLCNVEEDASLFLNWRYIYTIVILLSTAVQRRLRAVKCGGRGQSRSNRHP